MSQELLDSELVTDFIIESREHLETIEPNLLELEKTPENLALLNDIFRPMHSLKGASGFLGLNRINRLAHRAESILDELRKGDMVVTSAIMDIILSATDALNSMLTNLESTQAEGDTPIDHIIAQMESLLAGETPSTPELASEIPPPVQMPISQENPITLPNEIISNDAISNGNAQIINDTPLQINQNSMMQKRTIMLTSEWIQQLPTLPVVTLTAFGEQHLKDFIDETLENTANLSENLIKLEKMPADSTDLVNNTFRFFHNIKGNSGIMGFGDLNALTHEAETLLNLARQGNLIITNTLIDLLLVVVDTMEALIHCIDSSSGTLIPLDSSELLTQLKAAVAGEEPSLPASLFIINEHPMNNENTPNDTPLTSIGATDNDDIQLFSETIRQQKSIIENAFIILSNDPDLAPQHDALYRSFIAVQNASGFMEFEELREYAERTAGIVEQARKPNFEFSFVISILEQEAEIMFEMADNYIAEAITLGSLDNPTDITAMPESVNRISVEIISPEITKTPIAPTPVTTPSVSVATTPVPVATAPTAIKASAPIKQNAPLVQTKKDDKKPEKTSSNIRVDYEKLDHLMNLIGELLINRNRYAMIAKNLESAPPDLDMNEVAQDLSETTYAMSRVSDELQDTLMKVRMLPVSAVFSRFPRLVRDLSRKSNKEVELILEGEETELDKSVVEAINDPLMHLIRNSVDHGIESAEDRLRAGKSAQGRVTLRAYHKGNSVVIEVEDDGKGIDPDKMREVAVNKGIISQEEASNLSDREATELIFAPGFSSAEVITDISGRGVGMDVVRTNIKNLKGNISIQTVPGQGTRFTLSLPLTLAIIEALMIKMGEQMYAIPLDAVSTTTKLESERLTSINGRNAVTLRGEVLGIVDLGEILDLPSTIENDIISVVILQDNDRRIGLVVNQLLDRQEIVIKPLGVYLNNIKGLAGASIMGDGSVVLILDPHEIYTLASPKSNPAQQVA